MQSGAQLLLNYYFERKVCAECQGKLVVRHMLVLTSLFLTRDSFLNQSEISLTLYKWSREKP